MNESLQHLVFVRHGESEGDLRRAAWKRGETFVSVKMPEDEEITYRGVEQCQRAGLWILEHILNQNKLTQFDGNFVSLSLRSLQSAIALDTGCKDWQGDERLNERNRGSVRGLTPKQHHERFPDSYIMMRSDPLHWVPPQGQSIVDVMRCWQSFYQDIKDLRSVIVVGHRDQIWAAMKDIENLSDDELLAVDTDTIHNGQIIHYTSINPYTDEECMNLAWKRSTNIEAADGAAWERLPNIAI